MYQIGLFCCMHVPLNRPRYVHVQAARTSQKTEYMHIPPTFNQRPPKRMGLRYPSNPLRVFHHLMCYTVEMNVYNSSFAMELICI